MIFSTKIAISLSHDKSLVPCHVHMEYIVKDDEYIPLKAQSGKTSCILDST